MPDDLIVLCADKNMEHAVKGLLWRSKALNIRQPSFRLYVHPAKDPGCYLRSHEFLASFTSQFRYALVMHDRDGCGREVRSRVELEGDVERNLQSKGWSGRCAAIVLDPELEAWVWSDSPHVATALGWQKSMHELQVWLSNEGYPTNDLGKPADPKGAVEHVLRQVRVPRSSSMYLKLAQMVSVERCQDFAFAKLLSTFRNWFSESA